VVGDGWPTMPGWTGRSSCTPRSGTPGCSTGYKATLVIAPAAGAGLAPGAAARGGQRPGLTQRYFDTVAGVRPVAELYTPDLLALLNAQG
jgi:hypothetical protein